MRSEFQDVFKDAYDHWIDDACSQRYHASKSLALQVWNHQQSKVDELQKRVDASLIAFEKLKEEINELHGQCDLHLIKYLEEKSQVLEQALKGEQP